MLNILFVFCEKSLSFHSNCLPWLTLFFCDFRVTMIIKGNKNYFYCINMTILICGSTVALFVGYQTPVHEVKGVITSVV